MWEPASELRFHSTYRNSFRDSNLSSGHLLLSAWLVVYFESRLVVPADGIGVGGGSGAGAGADFVVPVVDEFEPLDWDLVFSVIRLSVIP